MLNLGFILNFFLSLEIAIQLKHVAALACTILDRQTDTQTYRQTDY